MPQKKDEPPVKLEGGTRKIKDEKEVAADPKLISNHYRSLSSSIVNYQGVIVGALLLECASIHHLLFPILHAATIYLSGNVEILLTTDNFIYC